MADNQNQTQNDENYNDPYQPIDQQSLNNNYTDPNFAQNTDYQPFDSNYDQNLIDPYSQAQTTYYSNNSYDQSQIDPSQNYDYADTPSQDQYSTTNTDTSYSQQVTEYDNPPQTEAPKTNTFEQQKSGSKVFLIGSIVLAVILIIAVGILLFITFNQGTTDNNNNQNNNAIVNDNGNQNNNQVVEEPAIDLASTGGSDTPASKARVNSETRLSSEWLLANFTRSDVNAEGVCIAINKCGENADPDKDGSTNIQEYNFGTDPQEADTDRDQIADGDELFIYYSDPKSARSDSDEFPDGAEISNCYDPISASSTKLTEQRIATISQNTGLRQLHEPTIVFLRGRGATPSDISNRGLVFANCPAPTTAPTTSGATPTTSTTRNDI
jgi:hypothetical protein